MNKIQAAIILFEDVPTATLADMSRAATKRLCDIGESNLPDNIKGELECNIRGMLNPLNKVLSYKIDGVTAFNEWKQREFNNNV